eukprot:g16281.t1
MCSSLRVSQTLVLRASASLKCPQELSMLSRGSQSQETKGVWKRSWARPDKELRRLLLQRHLPMYRSPLQVSSTESSASRPFFWQHAKRLSGTPVVTRQLCDSNPGTDIGCCSNPETDICCCSNPGADGCCGSNPGADGCNGIDPGAYIYCDSNPSTNTSRGSNPGADVRCCSNPGADIWSGSNPGAGGCCGSDPVADRCRGSNPRADISCGSNPGTDGCCGSDPAAPTSPVVALTCDTFLTNGGGTKCPEGFSPVGSGVSCGMGTACTQAACCEEDFVSPPDVPPPSPAPDALSTDAPPSSSATYDERSSVPTPSPSSGPTEMIVFSTNAGSTVSFLAFSGLVATTVSTLLGGTAGGSMAGAGAGAVSSGNGPTGSGGETNTASVRQPSATVAVMLIAQVQFLATLSLVDNMGAEKSALADFAENLRWVNLWPPASFAESVTPGSERRTARSLLSDELDSEGGDSGIDDDVESSSSDDNSSAMFMGNFTLFVGLLAGIFLVHVAVASAIEAYWLAKKRAKEQVEGARIEGIPLSQLSRRPSARQMQDEPDARPSFTSLWSFGSSGSDGSPANDANVERGQPRLRRSSGSWMNVKKVVECREKSQSAWLHFPHVELVFLLFAFEGAVAAQVSALVGDTSPGVFALALTCLILYPVLMIVMVSRTFASKVRTADNIVFKPNTEDDTNESVGGFCSSARNFVARVGTSLKEDHSMFAWADKGQWESVETEDKQVQRERDWFRIGFEPLFVDFTGKGAWFVVYTLIEWTALGVVGAVIEESVLQLSLFCAMHTVSFLLLVVLKPFANRVINAMGIALYGIDAACMAALAVSAHKWEGTWRADKVDSAVMIAQMVTLAAIIIPIYVDTSFVMIGALLQKLRKTKKADAKLDEEERIFMKRYIRRAWARIWCTMLRPAVATLEEGVADHATEGFRHLQTSSSTLSTLWSQLVPGGGRLVTLESSGINEAVSDTVQRKLDFSPAPAVGGAVYHPDKEIHRRLASRDDTGAGDGGPESFKAVVNELRCRADTGAVISCGSNPATDICCVSNPATDISCGSNPGTDVSCGSNPATDISCDSNPGTDICCGSNPDTDICCDSNPGTDICCGSNPGTDICCGSNHGTDICCGSNTGADISCDTYASTDICCGGNTGADISCGSNLGADISSLPPPTPAPALTTVPTASPTSAPTITLDEIVDSATAAGAVSVLTAGGLVVTTLSTLVGGTAGGLASSAATSAATSLVLQFLATLALVDNNSAVSGFAEKLRWINLWPPASFAESFTPGTEPRFEGSLSSDDVRRGAGAKDVEDDVASSSTSSMSSAVFMGNLTLFTAVLSSIFLAHVALASAIEAYWLAKERAQKQIVEARTQGIPLSQLSRGPTGREIQHDPDPEASSTSLLMLGSNGADGGPANDVDEAGGGSGARARSTWLNMSKIVECRERSQSAWLHFPHVELVFLLFAFEGAVVAQLLYPVLMIVMVSRTVASQVRAADNIVFKPNTEDDTNQSVGGFCSSARNFVARVGTSLKEDHSMFAWADKGQWESVETEDKQAQRERDWFRIGFEPLFVDFTGKGAWFVVYSLIEWAALGIVGVVVEDSVLQLSLFCAMHMVSLLLLLVFKPFANWIINAMGLSLYGLDAVCMAMLAVSAAKWEGSPRAKEVDSAVVIMQLIALSAIIIPTYVDTAVMIFGALWERLRKLEQKSEAQTDDDPNRKEERIFTNRYVRRAWSRLFCIMLRKNIFVCYRDTAAGVSSKVWASTATAAQTGPYPPLDPGDTAEPEGFQPRQPGINSVGTANTPIVGLSPRSQAIGRKADVHGVVWTTPARRLTQRPGSSVSARRDGGGQFTTSGMADSLLESTARNVVTKLSRNNRRGPVQSDFPIRRSMRY